MKKKIYIDCNIILDWLIDREPFSFYATKLVDMVESNEVIAYISPLILANVYYIISKDYNKKLAFEFIKDCCHIFNVLDLTNQVTQKAIKNKFKDFEDDLHYYTAFDNNIGTIITRNKKDYSSEKMDILTAEEYVNL